jgi:hypothetical protein
LLKRGTLALQRRIHQSLKAEQEAKEAKEEAEEMIAELKEKIVHYEIEISKQLKEKQGVELKLSTMMQEINNINQLNAQEINNQKTLGEQINTLLLTIRNLEAAKTAAENEKIMAVTARNKAEEKAQEAEEKANLIKQIWLENVQKKNPSQSKIEPQMKDHQDSIAQDDLARHSVDESLLAKTKAREALDTILIGRFKQIIGPARNCGEI